MVRRHVLRLVQRLHRHEWHTVGTNGFYLPNEEMCWGCGEYRHRILKAENLGKNHLEPWTLGKHPKRIEEESSLNA